MISFNEHTKVFSLNTQNSTYQMKIGNYGFLLHLYYGKKVIDTEMSYLIQSIDRGFSGNPYDAEDNRDFSLDTLPQEFSTFGLGDFRSSCISVINADGSNAIDLRYKSYKIYDGKPKLEGLPSVYCDNAQTLEIILEDSITNVEVKLLYSVIKDKDIITRSVIVKNNSDNTIILNKILSCCLDFNDNNYDLISFYGKHTLERQVERTPVRHGKILIDSIRGASSHHQNPFVILCENNANEDTGNCYGFSFVYSGNFMAEVEVDQSNQTRVTMGINSTAFRYSLQKDEYFVAPEVVLCFSDKGLSDMSKKYHRLYRNNLCRGYYKDKRRPILINNWEATYFDFDDEKLIKIAEDASKLGIEMLVMDDGWFGKRNDDKRGLGDWYVNENKLKCGLNKLCQKINSLNMKFGIWFEPEMISEDSDLYRNHKDWCLNIPNRKGNRSRYQFVLDMSRKEVVDYLFDSMYKILSSANIEYIKWDMNRHLTDIWSAKLPPERQGEVYHRYVLGVYDLLERLIQAFPKLLIEGCSGGGGRFDAGMLYYTPQIWCSDNTDAIERIKIQYGTSFNYPISTVGSHVSVCPNHQTQRTVPLKTRGIVAMAGTFGYELDITKMTEAEKQEVKQQIDDYKKYYDIITFGDYYRLTNPFENIYYTAWEFVSEDKTKALLNFVLLHSESNPPFINIKLKGLDNNKKYIINDEVQVYTGSALMNAGIMMPVLYGDYVSLQFDIKSID